MCADCDEFPCHRIEGLAKGYINLIPDMDRMKKIGFDAWFEEQKPCHIENMNDIGRVIALSSLPLMERKCNFQSSCDLIHAILVAKVTPSYAMSPNL